MNYLFIANGTKPSKEKYESKTDVKLNNFSIPNILAAKKLGYNVYMGVNKKYAKDLKSDFDVKFYNASIYRSIFNLYDIIKAFFRTNKFLRKNKIDVIHCNTPIGGVIGRICGKINKVPKVIYTAHGFHFFEGNKPILNMIFSGIEKFLARYTDTIIVMNEEDFESAKSFKLRNSGKVYLVHGVGVDSQDFILKSEQNREGFFKNLNMDIESKILITVGDLVPRKNILQSVKIVQEIEDDNLHLLICGTGNQMQAIEKYIIDHKLDNRVHLLGFRNDIKQLLSYSDLFLFTSFQEGLPRSVMEAMATGLPCIVSNIRGNSDLIDNGKGGYLCDLSDNTSFIVAINNVLNNKELSDNMRDYNLDKIKEYDTKVVKEEILDIYKKELNYEKD